MKFVLEPENDEQQRDNQVLWVKNLISDDYTQGRNLLHAERNSQHFYCCLGVLCETAGVDGVRTKDDDGYYYVYGGWSALPDASYHPFRAVGLSYGDLAELVQLNDAGNTFGDIVGGKLRKKFGDDVVNAARELLAEERSAV